MLGKMMNNFYYGKSGKGDFRKEDLPKNRLQLFFAMLRIRFTGLFSLNMLSIIAFIPLAVVLAYGALSLFTSLNVKATCDELLLKAGFVLDGAMDESTLALATQTLLDAGKTQTEINIALDFASCMRSLVLMTALLSIPCITLTGPVQAGLAYVTRNWARDEHAFLWADFRDAVKTNWKQGLLISLITGIIPLTVYTCWVYYESMAASNVIFIVPQALVCMVALVWMLALTYMYPLMVSYEATLGQIIKNAFMIALARLPLTVICRLIALIPGLIAVAVTFFTPYGLYALMGIGAYYVLIGNALSRFIYASLSNAAFDKLINVHMEGVEVNRGLAEDDDLDDEDEPTETEN